MTAARHAFPGSVSLLGISVAGLVLLPLACIVGLALWTQAALWRRLWHTRSPELLWSRASLSAGGGLGPLLLGGCLAWRVACREFPGRRVWQWSLMRPLGMPTYVL